MYLSQAQKDQLPGTKVILRLDLDLPLKNGQITSSFRLQKALPTIELLLKHGKKIVIIGHLGRPQSHDLQFSLKPVAHFLSQQLQTEIPLVELERAEEASANYPIIILENLRFYPGENENNLYFSRQLSLLGDVFVNDSFATSHRQLASTTGLSALLPTFYGLQFEKEIENLKLILLSPERPMVLLLGGAKPDKLENVDNFIKTFDRVLIGGKLSNYIKPNPKVFTADLTADGLDITSEAADEIIDSINSAKTIVFNGPVGKYEDGIHHKETEKIYHAISSSPALKIAGGGDTESALDKFGLTGTIDFISTGGGALLYHLAHGLPKLD